ncbi:MAG: ubiquinol-cytochrome C chaperone family protein [Pseudomonadota bacterium]
MSFFSRLLRPGADDRDPFRPVWYRIAELAREPRWYAPTRATRGVADTVAGRFDAITLVLCAVLLRMEQDPALIEPSVRLTELFVEDMDGQLRESGVGDLMVGKHIGKLMSTLGGRLGALRDALAQADDAALVDAIGRNVTLADTGDAAPVAALLRRFTVSLAALGADDILAARISLP